VVTGWKDLKESFRFIFRTQPVLWKVSLLYASVCFLLASLTLIAIPVLITQHLGFAPDTANRLYGYAQGVIAAGSVTGGLLAMVTGKKLTSKTGPFLLGGCALSMLMGGIALQTGRSSLEIYLVLVVGCGSLMTLSTLFQIQLMTFLQLLTPAALTGKVISCFICICMCAIPAGQFMYGIIFEHIGNHTYLPFYIAPLILAGISFFTRPFFYEIDRVL